MRNAHAEEEEEEVNLTGSRRRESRIENRIDREAKQFACIAWATRIDQSFANYARDFFSFLR